MSTPLRAFRDRYLETLLDFLWREWTALGVAGHDRTLPKHVVDPEALLLLTCSIGRYDPRLFDEVMDWLLINGSFVNVQRLRNILRKEEFGGVPVLVAVADWLSVRGKPQKWKPLAQTLKDRNPKCALPVEHRAREDSDLGMAYSPIGGAAVPFFYLPDGRPLPVLQDKDETFLRHGLLRTRLQPRGLSTAFPTNNLAARLLRLRALFGVSIRCDVLNYLALNGVGHPREVARELYYAQKSVYDVLADLEHAGVAVSAKGLRERTYRLTADGVGVAGATADDARWVNWPVLLAASESVWFLVERMQGAALESVEIAAEIRAKMRPVQDRLSRARWTPVIDSGERAGALALLEGFRDQLESIAQS
jgi:hypothetical protein